MVISSPQYAANLSAMFVRYLLDYTDVVPHDTRGMRRSTLHMCKVTTTMQISTTQNTLSVSASGEFRNVVKRSGGNAPVPEDCDHFVIHSRQDVQRITR